MQKIIKSTNKLFLKQTLKIGIIAGDDINKQASVYAKHLFLKFKNEFNFEFKFLEAGWETYCKYGVALPQFTINSLKNCDAALLGHIKYNNYDSKYISPVIEIFKYFDVFTNIKFNKSLLIDIPHNKSNINLVIVKENNLNFDLIKEKIIDEDAIYCKMISKSIIEKMANTAVDIALTNCKVAPIITIAHKVNMMPITETFFIKVCSNIFSKKKIQFNTVDIDNLALYLIETPQKFNIIVCQSLYSDILSNISAAVAGGLNVSANLNIGNNFVIAEPTYGSQNNPITMFRSIGLLMDYLSSTNNYSLTIDKAICEAYKNLWQNFTSDMNGFGSYDSAANCILNSIV